MQEGKYKRLKTVRKFYDNYSNKINYSVSITITIFYFIYIKFCLKGLYAENRILGKV